MKGKVFCFIDADFARVARNSAIDDFSWPQSAVEIEDKCVTVPDATKAEIFHTHVLDFYPDWLVSVSP